jgi:histidinol-phosphate/aromatic aminotransferase/cobyric acid decarboxylase-like protein
VSGRRKLVDYYRQFEAMSPEENAHRLREARKEQRSRELARVDELDLRSSAWHEPPDPEIVNAATFALRRSINRYPEPDAGPAVAAIASHHGVPESQVALGHGAGQLLQGALRELAADGEVVMPWPSWAPLPALAHRAGAHPVPVPLAADGSADLDALAGAVTDRTRAMLICSPNDPTGAVVSRDDLRAFAERLRPEITVIVDEALVELAAEDASVVPLLGELPNLLVLRSFSKAWAMAGLRVGYVLGSPEDAEALAALSPGQGVASPAQAAVAAALDDEMRGRLRLQQRRLLAARERAHLMQGIEGTPFAVDRSEVHLVWMRGEGMTAAQITHGLVGQRIHVTSGADWGDEEHVRVALRDRPATDRLIAALRVLAS